MAEDKSDKSGARQVEEEEVVEAGHVPDASNYKVQPTSYRLPDHMETIGGVPENRFQEEVLAGSDEDDGGGEDSHPEENQPVKGIGPDDELPDTTGRAALRKEKRQRS